MPLLETRDGKHLPTLSVTKHLRHDVCARDAVSGTRLNVIDRFDQEYHFLSNFYRVSIPAKVPHLSFSSVEQAFQWGKAFHAQDHTAMGRLAHAQLTAREAKQLGALVVHLPDTWAQYKVRLMLQLLHVKFQHPGLAGLLRKTRGFRLVEGNYWHDNFWGVCSCKACPGHGHNLLGRQLEKVRENL